MMTAGAVAVFVLGVILAIMGLVWAVGKLADWVISKNEEEGDMCSGHHFEETSKDKIEVRKDLGKLSIVVAKVRYRCQHEGCNAQKTQWQFDRFVWYGEERVSGSFYISGRVKRAVEELTEGQISNKYIDDLVVRYNSFGDVEFEVRRRK